eukprot:jgi/Mesen1/7924/ME000422S07079
MDDRKGQARQERGAVAAGGGRSFLEAVVENGQEPDAIAVDVAARKVGAGRSRWRQLKHTVRFTNQLSNFIAEGSGNILDESASTLGQLVSAPASPAEAEHNLDTDVPP